MNANWFNYALADAIATARLYKHHGVADDVERARDYHRELEASYRKLAEREKALTEALKLALKWAEPVGPRDPLRNESVSDLERARAALALHKEDA